MRRGPVLCVLACLAAACGSPACGSPSEGLRATSDDGALRKDDPTPVAVGEVHVTTAALRLAPEPTPMPAPVIAPAPAPVAAPKPVLTPPTLAADGTIDPAQSFAAQACADPSRVASLIDAKRGVRFSIEEEAAIDRKASRKVGTAKGKDAEKRLTALFADDLWCFRGYEADEPLGVPGTMDCTSDMPVKEPLLSDVKDDVVCFHRDQCNEWSSQGDLCLVRDGAAWRVAFYAIYPTGPIDPEEYRERAARQRAIALRAFGR